VQEFLWILSSLSANDVLDIVIVALLFFSLTFLFRGTQAVALFRGMMIILAGLVLLAGVFQFQALGWLLGNAVLLLALAIPVIFQPEIRRALEQVGRGSLRFSRASPDHVRQRVIDETCRAAEKLAERRHGALIVLQRHSSLDEFIRTGIRLESAYSAELLLTIFWPKTELHDGAVITDSAGRIASAAAVLPLTASRNLPHPKMGTRHRAALGISEVSDAVCVVVSEETGKIAVTSGGRMVSRLDVDRLRTILTAFYGPKATPREGLPARLQRWWRLLAPARHTEPS
jgi:diadenylate cyclase